MLLDNNTPLCNFIRQLYTLARMFVRIRVCVCVCVCAPPPHKPQLLV